MVNLTKLGRWLGLTTVEKRTEKDNEWELGERLYDGQERE